MPTRSAHTLPALAVGAAIALNVSSARAQQPTPISTFTLAEVVALAKERAPAVHAAFARIASAEAGVDRAAAARFPSLYLQGSGTGYATNGQVYSAGISSTTTNEAYAVGSGALNLSWTLYDFGHTGNAVDAAAAGVKSATLSARATEQIAMAEAAVAFFTLLADDALIASADAARGDRAHVVEITHHLVEGGYRTQLDETRAKIGLEVAELDLSVAKAARDNDSVNLATALLLDPATTFHLTPPAPLTVDEGAVGNGTVVLRARRDVAAAAARVDQARLGVTSAKRAYLPVLAVAASGQLLYSHDVASYPATPASGTPNTATYVPGTAAYTLTTDGPSEVVQGMVTLTVPIFDSLVNANVRAAEASLGEAQAGLEQISLSARSEALQASRQARSARVVLDQSERLATGTAANLAAVEDRYTSGMESPLSLADAQREDARARVDIVKARLAYAVAAVKLLAGMSRAEELLKVK